MSCSPEDREKEGGPIALRIGGCGEAGPNAHTLGIGGCFELRTLDLGIAV